MILIDSPFANTANIARALRACGADVELSSDAAAIARARKLVLPGVGSFAAAMRWLEETRIDDAIREAVAREAFLLGICVGHQLLFDVSYELGTTRGLGLVRGAIERFEGPLPVPQIGWNRVSGGQALLRVPASPRNGTRADERTGRSACPPLFAGIPDGTPFYFVNSYAARAADDEVARADYNGAFTAAVQRGRIAGVQFHPEKSSRAGLTVLRNFAQWN